MDANTQEAQFKLDFVEAFSGPGKGIDYDLENKVDVHHTPNAKALAAAFIKKHAIFMRCRGFFFVEENLDLDAKPVMAAVVACALAVMDRIDR